MTVRKKHSEAWIIGELIGIRTLEKHLCRKLESMSPESSHFLVHGLEDLNSRVALLDRALDEYRVEPDLSSLPPARVAG